MQLLRIIDIYIYLHAVRGSDTPSPLLGRGKKKTADILAVWIHFMSLFILARMEQQKQYAHWMITVMIDSERQQNEHCDIG